MTETIRIDDLREPRRNADEQQIFDLACSMEVDLTADTLVAAAIRRTGLQDFGDPTLLDRLAAQVAAVEADDGLSGLGRFLVRRRLVGLLAARLRFEDFVRRHPEALEVELEPPVIVVGLPRSGTTHLVNLLATDTRFRSMPWWEIAEPIPVLGDGPARDGIDPRYLRSLAEYEASREVSPLTALMHDRPPSSIEEECELLDLDLCTYVLEWSARVPTWRDHAEQLDQFAHYGFLRRELQVLSYLRGPNRWVLKCPQHLERLGPLMATFPDATIAFTLRDPVAVLQSAITMLAYGDRNRRLEIDADGLAAYWVDRVERLLRAAVRDTHLIPPAQRVDVEFGSFMADDVAVAAGVIATAGLEVTDDVRAGLDAYVAANPRGRDGRIVYDLRADFGIDPAELYERYAFYFDAFPQISPEVR
ncbi:MAG: sulfotransferase family protein [Microthrixaceae bacterium]